jgi:hypothetical protein
MLNAKWVRQFSPSFLEYIKHDLNCMKFKRQLIYIMQFERQLIYKFKNISILFNFNIYLIIKIIN